MGSWDEKNENGLNSCPFCDSNKTNMHLSTNCYFYVFCPECLARGPHEETNDEAVKKWNTLGDEIQDGIYESWGDDN